MSHAAIDQAVSLRGLIAATDVQLAEMKGADVVDLRAVADLKRHRDKLAAELEAGERPQGIEAKPAKAPAKRKPKAR